MRKKIFFIRTFFAGFLYLLLAATSSAEGEELQKINFQPMWVPQPQFAGYYMAREKGIYEKYGLDVTILDGGSKKGVMIMLKQGKIHFGILNLLTAMKEKAEGIPIVNVGQIFQKSSLEFVARKDSGIKSLADFNGRKIGVWRNVFQIQTHGFLKIHNIHADVYPVYDVINLFLKNVMDICPVMHYNEYNMLINHGINPEELVVFRLDQYGMGFPEDGIYCRRETLDEYPSLVRLFVEASIEGWMYSFEHPVETVDIIHEIRIKKNIQGSKIHLEWMMANVKEIITLKDKETPIGHLSEADFNRAMEFLLKTGDIRQHMTYGEFYHGNQ